MFYILCNKCGEKIKVDTDDNYNTYHTEICCPVCNSWQGVPMPDKDGWVKITFRDGSWMEYNPKKRKEYLRKLEMAIESANDT